MKHIRKTNMVISALLVIMIILHGIMGSFQLLGIGSHAGKTLAWAGLFLIILHAVNGIILTAQTFRAKYKSKGYFYIRQNAVFWIRRLTGIAIAFLIYFHIGMFSSKINENFVLLPFTTWKLIAMFALVLSVFLHIFVNVHPLLISMGILTDKERRVDILIFLSVILVFISITLILYYISWCI